MSLSLGIIIVNWNSYQVTSACLLSLRDCTYADFEVIVVDNGSNDHSGEQLKQNYPEITLLKNSENLGFTGGNNSGIAYALESGKELIMLLNNDTIVTSGFVEPMVAKLASDNQIGAIQPKIMFNQERDIIWNAGSEYSKVWSLTKTIGTDEKDSGQYDQAVKIPWVTGCCFLVRSDVVKEVGMLDDRFFIYFEDTDWSFRMVKAGHNLWYCPESKIYHEVGKSNENRDSFGEGNLSPFSHYVNMRNHIYIIRKHTRGFRLVTSYLYQIYKLTGYTVYFISKKRFRKLNASWRGALHGMFKSLS